MNHRLILLEREHFPRFQSTCTCGRWTSVRAKRLRGAVKQHRDHVNSERRLARVDAGTEPRATTPTDRLPEELT